MRARSSGGLEVIVLASVEPAGHALVVVLQTGIQAINRGGELRIGPDRFALRVREARPVHDAVAMVRTWPVSQELVDAPDKVRGAVKGFYAENEAHPYAALRSAGGA